MVALSALSDLVIFTVTANVNHTLLLLVVVALGVALIDQVDDNGR
jgi:hypothetical protein